MNRLILTLGCLLCASSLCTAQSTMQKPEFAYDGYKLSVTELESESKVYFGKRKAAEYSVEGKGVILTPAKEDVVAVSERMSVSRALTADELSLLKRTGSSSRRGSGRYAFVHGGSVEVELSKTALTRNPYTAKMMVATLDAIIAEGRESKQLPARAMEQLADLGFGLKVRITSVKVSRERAVSVHLECTRPRDGHTSAFVEGVYAVGADGEDIGGGRWTKGDPFGKRGSATAEFDVPRNARYETLRFSIVTRSQRKRLEFTMQDVFQR